MDTIKLLFGKRLAELRLKRNLSQESLAELIGVDQRTLSRIERGKSFPRKCFANILKAFDISAKEFFDWEHLAYSNEEKKKTVKSIIDELPPDLADLCFRIAKSWKS